MKNFSFLELWLQVVASLKMKKVSKVLVPSVQMIKEQFKKNKHLQFSTIQDKSVSMLRNLSWEENTTSLSTFLPQPRPKKLHSHWWQGLSPGRVTYAVTQRFILTSTLSCIQGSAFTVYKFLIMMVKQEAWNFHFPWNLTIIQLLFDAAVFRDTGETEGGLATYYLASYVSQAIILKHSS